MKKYLLIGGIVVITVAALALAMFKVNNNDLPDDNPTTAEVSRKTFTKLTEADGELANTFTRMSEVHALEVSVVYPESWSIDESTLSETLTFKDKAFKLERYKSDRDISDETQFIHDQQAEGKVEFKGVWNWQLAETFKVGGEDAVMVPVILSDKNEVAHIYTKRDEFIYHVSFPTKSESISQADLDVMRLIGLRFNFK